MNQIVSAKSKVDTLSTDYKKYIAELRKNWLAQNRSTSHDVYEVMSTQDRKEVHSIIARWVRYITPLAEAWWRERGYRVIWPEKDSEPMQVYKLENETV